VTENTHPSYPSPTIQEALCEIRFPADPAQFSTQFGQVWDRLRGEYPNLTTQVDVLPPSAPNIITSGPVPTQPRFILRHARRQILLQFVPGAFTFNTLPPYLGWLTMRDDIETAWKSIQEVLALTQVTTVTVRYINRVLLPSKLEDTRGWFEASDYLPTAVIHSPPPFQSRVQTGTGTQNMTTLTIGPPNVPGEPETVMLVDMERNLIGDFSAESAQIMPQADALHSDIWDIFKAIKGPRWNDVLEGKPL